MVGIHIGVDFEHESAERFLFGPHFALHGLNRARRRGDFHETVEKLLHAERVERGAEEHRCDFSVQICLFVEVGIYALNQFEVFAELVCVGFPYKLIHLRGRHIGYLNAFRHGLLRRGEEVGSRVRICCRLP